MCLLDLQPDVADDLAPGDDIAREHLAQRFGRAVDRIGAEGEQSIARRESVPPMPPLLTVRALAWCVV
jgi:hypothetical protein